MTDMSGHLAYHGTIGSPDIELQDCKQATGHRFRTKIFAEKSAHHLSDQHSLLFREITFLRPQQWI